MPRRLRPLLLLTFVLLALYTFTQTEQHEDDYPDYTATKISLGLKIISLKFDSPFQLGCRTPNALTKANAEKANATFVMLARNSEIGDVVKSIKSMHTHFNQWFDYPWVFLNNEEFDERFKREVLKHAKNARFGLVPPEHWEFDIAEDVLNEHLQNQGDRRVLYGNLASYHKMCRFYSGFFFKHPLVAQHEWFWRVEPGVEFFCDLTYDPFLEMEKHGKVYGFNVALHELYYTVPSLMPETKAFIKKMGIQVQSGWDIFVKKYGSVTGKNARDYERHKGSRDMVLEVEKVVNMRKLLAATGKKDGDLDVNYNHVRDVFDEAYDKPQLSWDRVDDEEFNLCHFWSNFEIAKTSLFASDMYAAYFDHLDKSGGFYKERWGDAPVHTLAVAMLVPKEQIHYFRDIGYKHLELVHCPRNAPNSESSWFGPDKPHRNGVGCRCRCPRSKDVEDNPCMLQFAHVMSDHYVPKGPINVDLMERMVEGNINRHLRRGGKLGERSVQGMH